MRESYDCVSALVFVAWMWLDVSTEYKWAETVKHELQTDGFTITREQRVGDLALPWTWVHAPIKLVGFQRILATSVDGLIYGVDGYIRLVSEDKTEHAAWLRKIDCQGRRFAQLSLNETEETFKNLEQIEGVLGNIEWIAQGQSVNAEYREAYGTADLELQKRGISNIIPFSELWEWYGRWSSGDLPSWQSRRDFLSELFTPLIAQVRARGAGRAPRFEQPTGWTKVDRTVDEIRRRLAEARIEEQFQTVGLLCREALISLSQAVYDPERHPLSMALTPVPRMQNACSLRTLPSRSRADRTKFSAAMLAPQST